MATLSSTSKSIHPATISITMRKAFDIFNGGAIVQKNLIAFVSTTSKRFFAISLILLQAAVTLKQLFNGHAEGFCKANFD